jgi:hypothetical protein
VIADTWLLLSLRFQVAWNSFMGRKLYARVLSVLGGLWLAAMGGTFSVLIGLGAGIVLRNFPDAGIDALVPGVILSGVTLLLLLSSFGIALGSLFLTSDLDLLMAAPIDRKAVFISKLLDGMAWNYTIVAVLALPALFTFGIGMAYGPAYYLLALMAAVGMPLLPAGLGALLVMLVARFAPARRVREVLGVMAALFGISCGLLGQTTRLWMPSFSSRRPGFGTEEWVMQLRWVADLPLPPMMAGRGLAAAGAGEWLGGCACRAAAPPGAASSGPPRPRPEAACSVAPPPTWRSCSRTGASSPATCATSPRSCRRCSSCPWST